MKRIFLTVDTECHDINKINLYIYGSKNSEHWGIKKILELAKMEQIPVNFFVDIGESKRYGNDYIKNLVDIIHSYNQPIFFHLHPEYISGDFSRTFIWMYNSEEKRKIFNEAYDIYKEYVHSQDRLVFRAGRYGIDLELLKLLQEQPVKVLDLSYIYGAPKMCHLFESDIGVKNRAVEIDNVVILPTTRFIGFSYFGITRCIGLDSSDATFNEYKRILSKTRLSDLIWTMHSWNFIKKWFFFSKYFQRDFSMVRKFKKSVRYAQKKGFVFTNLENYQFSFEQDELIDLCTGFYGKILGIINNFFRFKKIARINKRYFGLYVLFYLLCILILFSFCFLMIPSSI